MLPSTIETNIEIKKNKKHFNKLLSYGNIENR